MEEPRITSIYMIVNILEGKVYIGKTCKDPWKRRWMRHKSDAKRGETTYLHNSIRSHGVESFDVVKIDEEKDPKAACELEKYYISVYQSDKRDHGYNLTRGGDGMPANEETRRKISETHKRLGTKPPGTKGRVWGPDARKNMSLGHLGQKAWNAGKPMTESHKASLRKPKAPYVRHGKQVREDVSTSEIVRLYDEGKGLNCRAIGKLFGVSHSTVALRLQKAGTMLRPAGFQKGKRCAPRALAKNVEPLRSGSTSTNYLH